jgi:indole-3-glycerol phosphate synthase
MILEKIVAQKRREVDALKDQVNWRYFESTANFQSPTLSLKDYLSRSTGLGIIAEIKRRSPSVGELHPNLKVKDVSIDYMRSGASALSVLTDKEFFGGSLEDLKEARYYNLCPIIRKDFIIDELQIYQARAFGADVILLIKAILSPEQIINLAKKAKELNLEVLLEVHTAEEIKDCSEVFSFIDLVGFNSRNLNDFTVDIQRALDAFSLLPVDLIKVAESGINSPESFASLYKCGYRGFLIGEYFMKTGDVGRSCSKLISDVRKLLS